MFDGLGHAARYTNRRHPVAPMDATAPAPHPPFSSTSSAFTPWTARNRSLPPLPPTTTAALHLQHSCSPPPVSSTTSSPSPSSLYASPRLTRQPLRSATFDLLAVYRACNPDFRFEHAVPRRCLTKPSEGVYNNEWDNCYHDYILYVNDSLEDDNGNVFAVLDMLGTGTFGQVVKCRNQKTSEIVAVKVIKNQPAYFQQAWLEINILRMLHLNNDPDHTQHIVKLYSYFVFRGHLCLVFERLSINLYELMKQSGYVGIGLDLLRNFVSQILDALQVLVRSEVIHCDLKPENILVKAIDTTELKLIDFGSACQLQHPVYSYVQSRYYRSPEVLLGWPKYNSQIDMWSLGCVTAELFLGFPLFPGQNQMDMICRIVEMLGDMPDRFLQMCRETDKFFNRGRLNNHPSSHAPMHVYQLKSIAQYEQENSVTQPEWKRFFSEKSLEDIIMSYRRRSVVPSVDEMNLRESLVDFLRGMLRVDPRDRWTPLEAMHHPFLKGEPLLKGEPWIPPSHVRRVQWTRPVAIGNPTPSQDAASQNGMYSASAPNFNARGPLAQVQARWPANVAPDAAAAAVAAAVAVSSGNSSTNPSQQRGTSRGRAFVPQPPSGAFGLAAYSDPASSAMPLAGVPGSYIPPSALSSYASSFSNALLAAQHRGPPVGLSVGSYDGLSIFYSPHNNDLHMQPHQPVSQPQTQHQVTAHGVPDNSNAIMPLTPSVGFGVPGGTIRRGSGLHVSGSRESLTGSLHMSASKESLGMCRDPSASDLHEEGVFTFGSDDEGFSSAAQPAMTVSQPISVSQSTQQGHHPMSYTHHPAGHHSTQGGHSGHAYLPPPGPWMGVSSMPTAATYGNPSNLSSYGYPLTNLQHSRSFRPVGQNTVHTSHSAATADINPADMSGAHTLRQITADNHVVNGGGEQPSPQPVNNVSNRDNNKPQQLHHSHGSGTKRDNHSPQWR